MNRWMDGWTDWRLLLSFLTSTFWQAKPRSVPTRSRNWMAASGEEWGCPELQRGLSLQPPRDPEALWGSQTRERGDKRGQVLQVLNTRGGHEQGQEQLITIPLR